MDSPGAFDDCFGRSDPWEHLRTYVSGQLSDLEANSVKPMALAADVPQRTLQRLLELVEWDQERLRDKLQQTIARDHADFYRRRAAGGSRQEDRSAAQERSEAAGAGGGRPAIVADTTHRRSVRQQSAG